MIFWMISLFLSPYPLPILSPLTVIYLSIVLWVKIFLFLEILSHFFQSSTDVTHNVLFPLSCFHAPFKKLLKNIVFTFSFCLFLGSRNLNIYRHSRWFWCNYSSEYILRNMDMTYVKMSTLQHDFWKWVFPSNFSQVKRKIKLFEMT